MPAEGKKPTIREIASQLHIPRRLYSLDRETRRGIQIPEIDAKKAALRLFLAYRTELTRLRVPADGTMHTVYTGEDTTDHLNVIFDHGFLAVITPTPTSRRTRQVVTVTTNPEHQLTQDEIEYYVGGTNTPVLVYPENALGIATKETTTADVRRALKVLADLRGIHADRVL